MTGPPASPKSRKAANKKNIPYIGLRYAYLDHKVKNFRSDIAEKQYEAFKKIPSDQEIALKLSSNKLKKN